MSHQPERKEKDCLNCKAIVEGRFCQVCGQENIITHQSFWSLLKHFLFDIFHFDGKFFDTLRFLLFRPGFVAKEYISGKRAKYLDPIRMYLFTSAFFFLVFFSISNLDSKGNTNKQWSELSKEDRLEMAEDYKERLQKNPNDTITQQKLALLLDTSRKVRLADVLLNEGLVINSKSYRSEEEYEALQKKLPQGKRDGWFMRKFVKRGIELNKKYEGNGDQIGRNILNTFLHRFPYILFISLPFFAAILKLLYRRNKNIYYSDHAIFTIYHYIFSFILLLIIFGLSALQNWLRWSIFGWMIFGLIISWLIYLYKGLRNFYSQGPGKTILKFFLLNLLGLLLLIIILLAFLLFTAFQI